MIFAILARLIKAANTSVYETAPDQGHQATSTSNVDNEVIRERSRIT